ncbi:hypothetical protein L3X38_014965 [Prunus dulcis]|uniref:MATE efflux family protein n=1 Tax=Prunus dulcis TaxID=3755 RepID=A0AAD4WRK0_PRUDU|nr:hypothetical protein L3X38_014965 [Prunus dulcis]
METPLLKGKGEVEAAADDYAAVRSFEEAMWVSWKEAAKLWRIAALVAFTTLFQYLVVSVTTVFGGHLGDLELSAISLSVTVISGIPFGLLCKDNSSVVLPCHIFAHSEVPSGSEQGLLENAVIAVGSFSICMNFQNWEIMLLVGLNAAIRDYFAMVFTNSEDMQRAVARLAYFLGVTMLLNSATVVLSGVAVGGGWQVMVAYINFAAYYLFGLPLAIFLGFKANLGALGLWGGMMSGSTFQILFLLIVTSRTNWDREVEQTTKRINRWGSQETKTDEITNKGS